MGVLWTEDGGRISVTRQGGLLEVKLQQASLLGETVSHERKRPRRSLVRRT